jgi:AcrR family transcriptional regulator
VAIEGTEYFVPYHVSDGAGAIPTLAAMSRSSLSGRRAQAARNDEAILASAREVFVADPDAPISAVADHAGVGISALYRRYKSKEDLLRKLCGDGLAVYIEITRAAVANTAGDGWQAFATFMQRIVAADTHALTRKLAGRFTPTPQLGEAAAVADDLNQQLVEHAHAAGVLRADVTAEDLTYIFEQVSSLRGPTRQRTAQLRARFLTLHLDSLRAPGHTPLPGPPPTADEQHARWNPSSPR